jgi:hypothetical protein
MPYEKLKSEHYANIGGINAKASKKLTGINEVLNLENLDFSMTGSFTKRPGSTQMNGATLTGTITGFYEYTKLEGASFLIVTANTAAYAASGNVFFPIAANFVNPSFFSFITFVDLLFMSDGNNLVKFDGTNSYYYSLPPGVGLTGIASGTSSAAAPGNTGLIQFAYGYLNSAGYYGPIGPIIGISFAVEPNAILDGFTIPQGYGITAIVIYRTDPDLTTLARINIDYSNIPSGGTAVVSPAAAVTPDLAPTYLWFTMTPQALELYNNEVFLMGFSNSTVYFSDIGIAEGVGATNFIEVRTNDGDVVVGGRAYGPMLVIGKRHSTHFLTGNDPSNFLLNEITTEYGLLSKRAICTFNNICWYLDEKGIVQWDGANNQIISNKMEPFFRRMNVPVAQELAIMKHIKDRNEIWTTIPVDGATFNNLAIVFDYIAQGWMTYYGFYPSALDTFYGNMPTLQIGFGDYSGTIRAFGASLLGDSGQGITTLIKTAFNHDIGNSVEKLFRRLYVDIDPSLNNGATYNFKINFYTDQGATSVLTLPMPIAIPQQRLEYGLAAKDMAVEIINSDTSPLRINGYTIEYRFQRAV